MARINVGSYSQDEWNKHQEQIKAKNELEVMYVKAEEIDKKSIRPLRALQLGNNTKEEGNNTEEDRQILFGLESEIKEIRLRITELKKTLEVTYEV